MHSSMKPYHTRRKRRRSARIIRAHRGSTHRITRKIRRGGTVNREEKTIQPPSSDEASVDTESPIAVTSTIQTESSDPLTSVLQKGTSTSELVGTTESSDPLTSAIQKGFSTSGYIVGKAISLTVGTVTSTLGIATSIAESAIVSLAWRTMQPYISTVSTEVVSVLDANKAKILSSPRDICSTYTSKPDFVPICDQLDAFSKKLFDFVRTSVYNEKLSSIEVWYVIMSEFIDILSMIPQEDKQELISRMKEQFHAALKHESTRGVWGALRTFNVKSSRLSIESVTDAYTQMSAMKSGTEPSDPIQYDELETVMTGILSEPVAPVNLNRLKPALHSILQQLIQRKSAFSFPGVNMVFYIVKSAGVKIIFIILCRFVEDLNELTPSYVGFSDKEIKQLFHALIIMFVESTLELIVNLQTKSSTTLEQLLQRINAMLLKIKEIKAFDGQVTSPKIKLMISVLDGLDLTPVDTTPIPLEPEKDKKQDQLNSNIALTIFQKL